MKMCANQNAVKSCKSSDKTLTQKADRDIFERLLVIEGNREVNMKKNSNLLARSHTMGTGTSRWRTIKNGKVKAFRSC